MPHEPNSSNPAQLPEPDHTQESDPMKSPIKFGPFPVPSQVFHTSPTNLSFALVNLKPLLPGHVLICPRRVVPRFSQLTNPETADLFQTVKRVSKMIERVYAASSLNIAIQDGKDAGQSVPHVHVHVIPRKGGDLDEKGGSDAIYGMLEGQEGDLGAAQRSAAGQDDEGEGGREKRPKWSGPDVEADRRLRSEEEMGAEAEMLRGEMERDHDTDTEG